MGASDAQGAAAAGELRCLGCHMATLWRPKMPFIPAAPNTMASEEVLHIWRTAQVTY